MERGFSIKRAFLDLLFIKEQLKELFVGKEKYNQIIQYMLSKDFLDFDEQIPSLKQMGIDLKLKPHALRKLIQDLYNDIFPFSNSFDIVFSFKNLIFVFLYF